MLNIYQQLGGEAVVNDIVDHFYCKILEDKRINRFFERVRFDAGDLEKQIGHQRSFMAMMLGGPVHYQGKKLREAHAGLGRAIRYRMEALLCKNGPMQGEVCRE